MTFHWKGGWTVSVPALLFSCAATVALFTFTTLPVA